MSTNIKKISGNRYLYYTYFVKGKRHDVYCGRASKPESKKKALEAEIKYVTEQINHYQKRKARLENSIKNIRL